MPDDYGYINARVRAMKSFLLREEDYSTALRQRTEGEFASFLSTLPSYSNDIRQVLNIEFLAPASDEVLKLNMCRIFRKIITFCEGEPKRLILSLLRSWDLYNLKTIIRGILSAQDKAKVIQALLPAGKWDLEFLARLAEVRELETLGTLLRAADADDLEQEFAQLLNNYSSEPPLRVLEDNLQKAFFRNLEAHLSKRDNNAKIVLEYLLLQLDTVGSCKRQDPSSSAFGGLLRTRPSGERLLQRSRLFSFCSELYTRGDPLSIGIPLAFINFKENEVNNLRLISKGIAFGMPEGLIRQGLIYA